MSYESLLPLMQKKGCSLSPEKFQERVNIVFHDHEAALYDTMHADMKDSLQEQVDLLIADLLEMGNFAGRKLHVIDVGCGTGLSSEFLLESDLNEQIESITLLDTSEKMLHYAGQKAEGWKKAHHLKNGYISDVKDKFDLVLVCSVLHHIPDLKDFLRNIDRILNPGGVFLHLQDPNEDFLTDPNYLKRLSSFRPKSEAKLTRKEWAIFIPKSIRFKIKSVLGRKTYIDRINDDLIREKVISKKMSAAEIWSVTDIHVSSKKGISFKFLAESLPNFVLVNRRSYGFFGKLKSELPQKYIKEEEKFISQNRLDGRNLSAVWVKK